MSVYDVDGNEINVGDKIITVVKAVGLEAGKSGVVYVIEGDIFRFRTEIQGPTSWGFYSKGRFCKNLTPQDDGVYDGDDWE